MPCFLGETNMKMSGRRLLLLFFLLFIFFSDALAFTTGRPLRDSVNVRKGPGKDHAKVGQVSKKDTVTVVAAEAGRDGRTWYRIILPDGKEGYISSEYLAVDEPEKTDLSSTAVQSNEPVQVIPSSSDNAMPEPVTSGISSNAGTTDNPLQELMGLFGSSNKTDTDKLHLKSPSSFDERRLDQYGQPTMFAITELTGPELVKLLEEQGYLWEEKDEILRQFKRKLLPPGERISQFVTFKSSNGFYEGIWAREDYNRATEKGGAAAGQVSYIMAGYGIPGADSGVIMDDVVKAFVNIETEDKVTADEVNMTFVKVKDSAGRNQRTERREQAYR